MTGAGLASEPRLFLSTELSGRREVRFATAALLVSGLLFAVSVPFARVPLEKVPAFIPIYVTLLVICDLITAVLLFGQFNFLRSRALLVLAGGYLFTASITFAYALIFPGLFSPTGLFGAGSQTTSFLYISWHGAFPLAVIAYALQGSKAAGTPAPPTRSPRTEILWLVAAVLALACGITFLGTAAHEYLPVFIQGDRTTSLGRAVLSGVWLLSLCALVLLWRRRPHAVLDVWLMVVMGVWLFDLALAAVLNTGRYDLGWYVGRIYGLLAASFLLIVLLTENSMYFSRLVLLSAKLSTANNALELLSLQDGLTDIANRRRFDLYLAEQFAVARRQKRTLALVLCDVDAFKAYNDHYGHQAGDECLKQVAAAISACCRRPADLAARYGGEEFAMILPDTELAGARRIAEAARQAVAQLRIPHAHSPAGSFVSISGGVAVSPRKPDGSVQLLITVADECLYRAKNGGRNRMVAVQAEAA